MPIVILKIPAPAIGMAVAVYGLARFLVAVPAGRVADWLGRRPTLAIGGIIAEAAWATHFLPLEESSAAVLLLLTFYLTTGLMHSYLGNKLNPRTATEFAGVGARGFVIIAISHFAN